MTESQNFSPFEIAELASALGTLDAKAANLRRSRRLFRLSLANPSENAVAQARWAMTKHIMDMNPAILNVPRTYEARAWYRFYSGEWKWSLNESQEWLRDQPFSAAPAVHASYVAAVSLEDHEQALKILARGLLANPHDRNLLNNRAYSLASLRHLVEAKQKPVRPASRS